MQQMKSNMSVVQVKNGKHLQMLVTPKNGIIETLARCVIPMHHVHLTLYSKTLTHFDDPRKLGLKAVHFQVL